MSEPITGATMSVAEQGLLRKRMSWAEFLGMPDQPRAEWVDGEVVVSPPVSFDHGEAVGALVTAVRTALPALLVVTEVGVWLPRNRLRAPDVMVVDRRPEGRWVTDPPIVVVEVLSPSTRSEDTMRKAAEYLAADILQYWVVDPDARVIDVFEAVDGAWERVLRLDEVASRGEVVVGRHGTVPLDLLDIVPTGGA